MAAATLPQSQADAMARSKSNIATPRAKHKKNHKFIKEALGNIAVDVVDAQRAANMEHNMCFSNCEQKAPELDGVPVLV